MGFHGDHELTDSAAQRVAQLGRRQVARRDAHDGEVGQAVAPDHLVGQLGTVVEHGGADPATGDDVREVTSSPSLDSATADPFPAAWRRLATEGSRRSATATTVRE